MTGKQLRQLRRNKDVTQQELADYLCLSKSMICKIEQSVRKFKLEDEILAIQFLESIEINEY